MSKAKKENKPVTSPLPRDWPYKLSIPSGTLARIGPFTIVVKPK